MKESLLKVKEIRASTRQLTRIILIAVVLELLRPVIHPAAVGVHDAAGRKTGKSTITADAARLPELPLIAPRAIVLVGPLPGIPAALALL